MPLDEAGFNANRVGREWQLLRAFITSFYINAVLKNPLSLEKMWQNIIKFRQNEHTNVCLLVSLLICHSGSNSTVERAFSVLNLILGDRRPSLVNQATIDIIIVKCNDRNWGFQENSEMIERALEIYTMNRRVGPPSNVEEPAEKIMSFEMPVGNSVDSESLILLIQIQVVQVIQMILRAKTVIWTEPLKESFSLIHISRFAL